MAWLPSCSHAANCRCDNITMCVCRESATNDTRILTCTSTSPRRMFFNLAAHTGHLSHLPLLHTLQPGVLSSTSSAASYKRNQEHCSKCSAGGPRGILRYLHNPRWIGMAMLKQRHCPRTADGAGPGSSELDMGSSNLQGCSRISIPLVSTFTPSQ